MPSTDIKSPKLMFASSLCNYTKGEKSRRQIESSKARDLSARLLEHQGFDDRIVVKGEKGEPVWPVGAAGSITHCRLNDTCSFVAVATTKSKSLIGIDAECCQATGRMPKLAARIFSAEEIEILNSTSLDGLLLGFSAKESIYKALYPLLKKWFWFNQVKIVHSDLNTLTVAPCPSLFEGTGAEELYEGLKHLKVRWEKITVPGIADVIFSCVACEVGGEKIEVDFLGLGYK